MLAAPAGPRRPVEGECVGLGPVRGLDVVLSTACNLRCAYCFQDHRDARRMSVALLLRAIDALLASPHDEVVLGFHGGEPLLHLDLIRKAIAYAEGQPRRRSRLRYALTTNGTLLSAEARDLLASYDFSVQVSFDGVPQAQRLRGEGSHALVEASLRALRRAHPSYFRERVHVAVTLTSSAVPHLSASIASLLRLGLSRIDVAPVVTHDPGWTEEVTAELDRQLGKAFRLSLRHLERTGRVPLRLFARSGGDGAPARSRGATCGIARARALTLAPDGTLHGCPMVTSSTQRLPAFLEERLAPMRLGTMDGGPLAERLPAFRAAVRAAGLFDRRERKGTTAHRCASCRHAASCGVCPVSIGHLPGNADPDRVPEHSCAFYRVAGAWRERFPALPHPVEAALGAAGLPAFLGKRGPRARTGIIGPSRRPT